MLLTIEKLIYGGDGLARERGADLAIPEARVRESKAHVPDGAQHHQRGKAVFIPFTLAGEEVEATATEQKTGFARAQLDRIVTASPHRTEPACAYFQRCGGCHYQHTTYDQQLAIKAEILKETLRRQARLELASPIQVHSADPWHYRNRTRFQVRTAPDFRAGFFRFGSHEVLPVESCPISSPLINRAFAALWELGRAGEIPAELREIEFFANADDSRLLSELWFESRAAQDQRIALGERVTDRLRDKVPAMISSYVFPQSPPKAAPAEQPDWALGGGEFRYRLRNSELRVSGGSFFQVNRFLVEKLVELVTADRSGELALDLYAGVGLFTQALERSFRHIVSVESSQSSAADLKYNSPANAKVIRTTVEEFLSSKARRGPPQFIVVDPPRAGLGDRVARALSAAGAERIAYVSCDPATLARDLVHLLAGGYRAEQVHLIDLFPQTYHLETVTHLVR